MIVTFIPLMLTHCCLSHAISYMNNLGPCIFLTPHFSFHKTDDGILIPNSLTLILCDHHESWYFQNLELTSHSIDLENIPLLIQFLFLKMKKGLQRAYRDIAPRYFKLLKFITEHIRVWEAQRITWNYGFRK